MLLTKTINKVFRTTLFMFLILSVFTITNKTNEKVLRTNIEFNNAIEIPKTNIYLLSEDNYLVKVNIYLEDCSTEEKIKKIIEYLKVDNNKIPQGLKGYIPKNIQVNSIIIEENNLKINFSSEFLTIQNKDLVITALIYSLTEIPDVKTIELLVDNKYLKEYQSKLNKEIGINKEYILNDRKNINKVTVYYYDEINNIEYLTPVTKYVNDNREKVEIIINELSNNIPNNLISYLNEDTMLVDYKEENDFIALNFNKGFNNNQIINNKIINLISESIFENYDIKMILFQENGKKIDLISKK